MGSHRGLALPPCLRPHLWGGGDGEVESKLPRTSGQSSGSGDRAKSGDGGDVLSSWLPRGAATNGF